MADTLKSPMHVEIISPDGPIFKADGVKMVVARATDGEFAVMKNHLPMVAALEVAPVRIIFESATVYAAVFNGFFEMEDNHVNIIAPVAEMADHIDVGRAMASKKRAEARLQSKDAAIDFDRARLSLERALLRLNVAEHK